MHPIIKIICVLIMSAFLSLGQWQIMSFIALLLAYIFIRRGLQHRRQLLAMLTRMRWFFISIIIIYLWMTPGTPVIHIYAGVYESWLPTWEGVTQGSIRVMVFMLIILQVNLFLHSVNRDQLISAISWFCAPLSLLGVRPMTIALRIALTLEAIVPMQELVRQNMTSNAASKNASSTRANTVSPLHFFSSTSAVLFGRVLQHANSQKQQTIVIKNLARPVPVQWLLPTALLLLLSYLYQFV